MVLICVATMVLAQGVDEQLFAAHSAYDQGNYAVAAEAYRKLLETEPNSADLHYNLGNAELRAGRVGHAIASYRRCLDLSPRHSDAVFNLHFARRQVRDDTPPPEPSAALRSVFFWYFALSERELFLLLVCLGVLVWGTLAFGLHRRHRSLVRLAIAGSTLYGVCAVSLAVSALFSSQVAVVVDDVIEVRSTPGQNGLVRFQLHDGAEVQVIDIEGEWVRIALVGSQNESRTLEQGWIHQDHVTFAPL